MISLQISDAVTEPVDSVLLERASTETLQHAGVPQDSVVTIVLSDDTHLFQLNQQFLGIDAPTDVLSFPGGYVDPDTDNPYLGDVILSYERAVVQAQVGGHPVEQELQLLVVHGILHLLGYDDEQEDERARMWAAQSEILEKLGSQISPPL